MPQMVLNSRRIEVREIAEAIGISTYAMPYLVALDQKRVPVNISNALLAQFRRRTMDCEGEIGTKESEN